MDYFTAILHCRQWRNISGRPPDTTLFGRHMPAGFVGIRVFIWDFEGNAWSSELA